MLNEMKATGAQEVTKMRQDWDALQQKIRELESQLDVSQAVVTEVMAERDALRKTFGTRQFQVEADDQDDRTPISELKSLLEEGASSAQLLNRFAEVTERSAEKLAQKTEVCPCLFDPMIPVPACFVLLFFPYPCTHWMSISLYSSFPSPPAEVDQH